MGIFNIIKRLVAEFIKPLEAHYGVDTIAYHAQANDRELRFSPANALRRHY